MTLLRLAKNLPKNLLSMDFSQGKDDDDYLAL